MGQQTASVKNAFSLVELSIVLVILGLLVGGVLGGQSLIHAAQLRSVVRDTSTYMTAYMSFRDRYQSLPGDMNNATQFWGTDPNGCPLNTVTTARSTTCDGDGDGKIEKWAEVFRAWQHLASASLVKGQYAGIPTGASANRASPGVNAPTSSLSNTASYGWVYSLALISDPNLFDAPDGNYLRFGAASDIDDPIIKAEDAWNIDKKLDDGSPAYGKVRAPKSAIRPLCTSSDVATTATYLLTDTSLGCNMFVSMI